MKKALTARGVKHMKINHFIFKQVTEDDEVISREALKDLTPLTNEDEQKSKKVFIDMMLERLLGEELRELLYHREPFERPGSAFQENDSNRSCRYR